MLKQLIERSESYDQDKRDVGPHVANGGFSFDSVTANIVCPPTLDDHLRGMTNGAYPLTDHALQQVCGRLGAAAWPGSQKTLPVDYLSTCPPTLLAKNLNHWVDRLPADREWFVRTYQDQCRAILTDRFSVVDVTETLRWVQQILDDKSGNGATLFRPVVTPDVLHLRILVKEVKPPKGSPYAVGTYVTTGEIGNRRIGVFPLIQRTVCTNSITWKKEGAWEHIHTGSRAVLRQEFLIHMVDAFEASGRLLEAMLDAETNKVPNFDELVTEMCERNGWSESVQNSIFFGAESQDTTFGLVNGLSYMAHKHFSEDPDKQADVEALAGSFLEAMVKERERVG